MNWKEMSLTQKIATVIAGLAIVVWVVFQVQPKLLPFDPTNPGIAVVTICEAVVYWKTQRKWAYLLIAAAVIFIGCSIWELFL
jgi:predicted exporter